MAVAERKAAYALPGRRHPRLVGYSTWLRRHSVWVLRFGGATLILIGVLLVTGLWNEISVWMRVWASGFEVGL